MHLQRRILGLALSLACAIAANGAQLLNIDYGVGSSSPKTGPAAVGIATNDYWNLFNRDSSSVPNAPNGMKWSDGTSAGAQLTVENAGGAWGTGSSDPMLQTYLYPSSHSGNVVSHFTSFPLGTYDVYVYSHGQPGNENGVVEMVVGGVSLGIKSTTTISAWDTPGWTEGNEYVVFHGVVVGGDGSFQIVCRPGGDGTAVINGVQFISVVPTAPAITKQPAAGTAFAGDSVFLKVDATGSNLSYQWRLNGVPLDGKTSSTLEIPNFSATNVGSYSVRVKNDAGEALSKSVGWALAARASGKVIDINYTAHLNPTFSVKSGPAAIGAVTNDFWNVYSRDVSSLNDWRAGGVVSGLKYTDGVSTPATLTVTNAAGAWLTLMDDPMMQSYLYPLGNSGEIKSKLSALPAQRYDVFVYAHGQPPQENAIIDLRVNDVVIDSHSTSSQPGWDAPAWVEGNQFVVFRGVEVADGASVEVVSHGGESGLAVMNGIQLAAQPSLLHIVNQPTSQTVTNGQQVGFSVDVEGSGTLAYQWFKNGFSIDGGTNQQFTINAAGAGDIGKYSVRAQNDNAVVVSLPAFLTIQNSTVSAPVITQQPRGGSYFVGDSVRMTVAADGGGLAYQWRKGDSILEGKTSASLEISNFASADVGFYSVLVSNGGGSVVSAPATLSLAERVPGPLLDINYTAHLNPTFSAKTGPAAVGISSNDVWNVYSRDVSSEWDWRAGGTVTNLAWTDASSSGASLTVDNAEGAWLTLSDDPMFQSYLYPISRSGAISSKLDHLPAQKYDIYVYAHGQPPEENAVVELKVGGVSVSSLNTSTNASWLTSAWVSGNQFVVFSGIEVPAETSVEIVSRPGSSGLAVMNGIQLVARPSSLQITTQPISQAVTVGSNVVFTVQATASGTISYQWLRNGTAIDGATGSEFNIESASLNDAAGYSVRVQSEGAVVVSHVATLTVSPGATGQRNLLNLDFATTADYGLEVGPAAVGFATNDYWNLYSRDTHGLIQAPQGMKWSDGTLAGALVKVDNADGAWGSGASDPMMHTYLYPLGRNGDITASFTNLPSGLYDIFVYAHGQPAEENGVVELVVNGVSHGTKSTSSASDWDGPGWTEGKEYVLFTGVDVPNDAALQIIAHPGVSGLSVLNGAQFLSAPLAPTAPRVLTQPVGGSFFIGQSLNLNVTAEGARPLAYQWRHEGTNLIASDRVIGIDSPYLKISNVQIADAGSYSVALSNSLGQTNSESATVTVVVDQSGPSVVITSPVPGAQDSAGFTLQGTVTDNNGVASVKWQRNGVAMGSLTLTEGHFSLSGLRFDPGENHITVVATDLSGNEGHAEVVSTFSVPRALVLGSVVPQQDGSHFVVPISIVSTGGVSGATFTLSFDTNYLADAQFEWTDAVSAGFASVNLETPKRFRASFALPGVDLPTGSSQIAAIRFRARSVPATLTTPLGLEIVGMYSNSGDAYVTGNLATPTTLTITKRKIVGDNNANDRLDVGDASVMLQMVSRIQPVRFWDPSLNDLNKNVDLDSGDVIKVLRAVVGLDPQPTVPIAPAAASKKSQLSAGSEIVIGIPTFDPVVPYINGLLVADKAMAAPGDKVTMEVHINGQTKPISGASFRLEYPADALRLDDATARQLGTMVPAGSAAVWSLSSSADFAGQNGVISLAVSSATAWPTNNGVLARFTFTVQPAATALYSWPIWVRNLEVSRDGFTTDALGQGSWTFTGHTPGQPTLNSGVSVTVGGGAQIFLHGDAGASFTVEVSTDLKTWSPIYTGYTADGSIVATDPANNETARFYRAIQLPNQ